MIDVLIVGSGISGLCAGQKLHRKGYQVTVVEARSRIGGRVFPQSVGANLLPKDMADKYSSIDIEYGANWVHGLDNSNPVYLIAKKENFEFVRSTGDDDIDCDAVIANRRHFTQHKTPRIYSRQEMESASEYLDVMREIFKRIRHRVAKKRASVRRRMTSRDVLIRAMEIRPPTNTSDSDIIDWLHEQNGIAEAHDLDMIR